MGVTAAPPALTAVVFQRVIIFRRFHSRQRRLMAHPGPAQVGVQHNARAVNHRPQAHAAVFLGDFQRQGRRRFRREFRLFSSQNPPPQLLRRLPGRLGHRGPFALGHGLRRLGLGQNLVDFGDLPQQFFFDFHSILSSSCRPAGGAILTNIIHHPRQGRKETFAPKRAPARPSCSGGSFAI